MTKSIEKRLLSLVTRAEAEILKIREALSTAAATAAASAASQEVAGPARARATRHSRDLAKRIDRAALALGKARDLLAKE